MSSPSPLAELERERRGRGRDGIREGSRGKEEHPRPHSWRRVSISYSFKNPTRTSERKIVGR